MSVTRHPRTGVLLNDIQILRTGKLTEEERQTVDLLLWEGLPRWLVAAQMGRHPLSIGEAADRRATTRRPRGNSLSRAAARTDPRQIDLIDLLQETENAKKNG